MASTVQPSPGAPERPTAARVLVVDDQRNMRASTALLLRAEGFSTGEASGGVEALALLRESTYEVLLTDLRMEPMDGLQLLKLAQDVSPRTQVIVMTAYGSIESAVEAMRLGAHDYLPKPFKDGELLSRVLRAAEKYRLLNAVQALASEFHRRHGLSALLGDSRPMRELTARICKVAPTDTSVLISGESGTGKELVARAIHALSLRQQRAFVPVNCAAIPESLLESELFGHARGAFTGAVRARPGLFEEAHGGTIFIDEVTETSVAFQSKLLRVLQEGELRRVGESTSIEVDTRVIAATNRGIEAEVEARRFREDLYYRLAVVPVQVPALRERLEDVPLLARHFLERANARARRSRTFSEAALEHLMGYAFPGNVRELENLVEQAVALAESDVLSPEDFPLRGLRAAPPVTAVGTGPGRTLAEAVSDAERAAIAQALDARPNDLAAVAEALGVSTTTLWRKMKRLNLKASDGDGERQTPT